MPTYEYPREEFLAPSDTLSGYDRWAASYDHETNPVIAATSWVLDHAPLGCADAEVVELGCGTGRNIPRVLGEGARSYVGVDGSYGMLNMASANVIDQDHIDVIGVGPDTFDEMEFYASIFDYIAYFD